MCLFRGFACLALVSQTGDGASTPSWRPVALDDLLQRALDAEARAARTPAGSMSGTGAGAGTRPGGAGSAGASAGASAPVKKPSQMEELLRFAREKAAKKASGGK